MQRSLANRLSATISGALLLGTAATATLIVPMSPQGLADSSDLVVTGIVDHIVGGELSDGRIVTRVSIAVDECWKGPATASIELVERGGIVGERGEIVYGAPSYQLGEPVVVFAAHTQLGWQTNHLLQGKFRIEHGAGGSVTAVREVGPGVAMLDGTAATWRAAIPLAELRAAVGKSAVSDKVGVAAPAGEPRMVRQVSSEFTTQTGNPRFFEADEDVPLVFVIDDRGDSILGLESSRRAVNDAFAAWNAVAATSLDLRDGGLSNDLRVVVPPGVHRVHFDDPFGEIFDPSSCTGTLGIGGALFTTSEQKSFGGSTYNRILNARVTFADNWDGCEEWSECNFSEVAAHEIGHAFGLGHSSERRPEIDAILREALMYFHPHFDGRCADPRQDDEAGIRAIYPELAPLSVANASPLPRAIMGQPYRVELQAVNAVSPLAWESIEFGCPTLSQIPGMSLDEDGVITGTVPQFTENLVETCLTIELTDAAGDRHAKRLDITFVRELATHTPTPLATSTAAANSPTPTPPVDRPCIGDCNGDGQISINELIRGVNIALRTAEVSTCESFDRDHNGRVSINELVGAVTAALFGCTS